MEIMSIIKGINYTYKTGDFLYKQICKNKGILFKLKLLLNTYKAQKAQEKLIKLAISDNLNSDDEKEQIRIERLKKRNFISLSLREQYTILQNDCLIITKELKVKSLNNQDIEIKTEFIPDYYNINEEITLNELKNNFRFTDFSLKCKVYDENDTEIEFNEQYTIQENLFSYQIKIQNNKKDKIYKIFYSISIPEEFKSKKIRTTYHTPIPYLEIIIQRDNYEGKIKIENFKPSIKKYLNDKEWIVDENIDNETFEGFYYLKSIWKIWYNDWEKLKKPKLIMEYKD